MKKTGAISFFVPGSDGPTAVFYAGKAGNQYGGLICGILLSVTGLCLLLSGRRK